MKTPMDLNIRNLEILLLDLNPKCLARAHNYMVQYFNHMSKETALYKEIYYSYLQAEFKREENIRENNHE